MTTTPGHDGLPFRKRQTPSGIGFGMLKVSVIEPAPLLFLLASSVEDTLTLEGYCRVGRLLGARGWNVVSLDLPCHGADRNAGEPVGSGLAGWAARIGQGEDIVTVFRERVNDVLEHLVSSKVADPRRIAAAGASRGGFMAFQAAAGNPNIRAVAAFAPVTDLLALREFAGQENNPLARRLALANAVDALADRAAWIAIGNADERVDTAKAVAFVHALTAAGRERGLAVEITLRVAPMPGHCSFPEWHDEAAAWFPRTLESAANEI